MCEINNTVAIYFSKNVYSCPQNYSYPLENNILFLDSAILKAFKLEISLYISYKCCCAQIHIWVGLIQFA